MNEQVAEVLSQLRVALAVGFVLSALAGGCLFVCWWKHANRADRHAHAIDNHAGHLNDHAGQLAGLAAQLQTLADFLRVDLYADDVDPDWAEQAEETSEPAPHLQPGPDAASPLATQEQQMTEPVDPLPPTEPMRAVPALVDDVPLARALAEIENSMRDWRTDLDAKLREAA